MSTRLCSNGEHDNSREEQLRGVDSMDLKAFRPRRQGNTVSSVYKHHGATQHPTLYPTSALDMIPDTPERTSLSSGVLVRYTNAVDRPLSAREFILNRNITNGDDSSRINIPGVSSRTAFVRMTQSITFVNFE